MTQFEKVTLPQLASLNVRIAPPAKLVLAGTITLKDPALDLGPFFKEVHDAASADELTQLEVDVSGLSFVNSSAIRLFVDWTSWIKASTAGRYKLHIVTSRHVTWQKTSFLALKSLAEGVLSIEQVD